MSEDGPSECEGGLDRRGLLGRLCAVAGLAAWSSPSTAPAICATGTEPPDFGPNVLVVAPGASEGETQAQINAIFRRQERAEFGDGRFAILLLPGRHRLEVNVGFYTQVLGLGQTPAEVIIDGHVHVEADWNNGVALVNFWRGVENLAISPPDGHDRWAVSQASPYRRVDLAGDLRLDDGGWSSGGFIADSRIRGTVRSGSQQQWLTRGGIIGGWQGANWNMVFVGVDGAPATSFPDPPLTTVPDMPRIREKPFLCVNARGEWQVFRPSLRDHAAGVSWAGGDAAGEALPLSMFFIAHPGERAATLNGALAQGRHILFTPGIYQLDAPLRVEMAGAILLGLGLATLVAVTGKPLILIGDVAGVTVAGLLLEAGPRPSTVLIQVGGDPRASADPAQPTLLADLFVRVGGASVGRVDTAMEINRAHTIADHLWIWRADHGDRPGGRVHIGWNESTGERGLVVYGDDVMIYGLFVEHFRQHQVVWTGERGRTDFFQCELPYDPPSQSAWRAGDKRGWAAYKVADTVRRHRAVGLGVYANFTADPSIVLTSAIEAPETPDVTFESVTTVSLGGGKGTIAHLVNDAGEAARPGATRQTLQRYPATSSEPT